MGQLLVRGLDDRIIGSLKRRAERNGRSVESEHRAILKSALAPETESLSYAELAARLRAEIPPSTLNSTDLIREDRDRNYDYDPDDP